MEVCQVRDSNPRSQQCELALKANAFNRSANLTAMGGGNLVVKISHVRGKEVSG